jgi:predicted membrane-bound spermidine synthase
MPANTASAPPQLPPRAVFVALFIVAAAGLIFEIALTRLFSLFFQYHFVFLAVSIAIFGLSIGAALARAIRPEPEELPARLVLLLAALSAAYPVVTFLIALLPSTASIWPRAVLAVLPFIGTGLFTATVFEAFSETSGRLYAADLIGAGSGVLAVIVLLNAVSAFNLVYLLGVALSAAGLYLARSLRAGPVRVPAAAAVLAIVIAGGNFATGLADYRPLLLNPDSAPRDKTMLFILHDPAQEAEIVLTEHSPLARVDVVSSSDPSALFVFTDGGAGSFMMRDEGGSEDLGLLSTIEALPFVVRQPGSALIVGSGGGRDILMALAGGTERITAVEVNPAILEAALALEDFNGRVYSRPEVEVVVGDGRNYAERTQKTFDLIYLNLVYSQAAEPAGQALVENYIFTEEAFEAYFSRLEPGGHIAIVTHNALEGSRAALTALKALENSGIPPSRGLDHLALWMYPADDATLRTSVMLVGKEPLTTETLEALTSGAVAHSMTALFSPGEYEFLFATLREMSDVDDFIDPGASYDLSPTTDNRPFFFKLDHGTPPAIGQALTASFFLAAALFIGALAARSGPSTARPPWWVLVIYTGLIGAGYLLVEIPIIQRLQLLLGYPVLTLAATLGALLFAGGFGSWISQRWPLETLPHRVAAAALLVAALALLYRTALPALVDALLPFGTVPRVLAAVILVGLIGLPMGIPFPSAIRMAGAARQRVALLWAVNGAFSVLGSVLAVSISMSSGFALAFVTGAGCYLALSLLVWWLIAERPTER